jgi:hypothetical protein
MIGVPDRSTSQQQQQQQQRTVTHSAPTLTPSTHLPYYLSTHSTLLLLFIPFIHLYHHKVKHQSQSCESTLLCLGYVDSIPGDRTCARNAQRLSRLLIVLGTAYHCHSRSTRVPLHSMHHVSTLPAYSLQLEPITSSSIHAPRHASVPRSRCMWHSSHVRIEC